MAFYYGDEFQPSPMMRDWTQAWTMAWAADEPGKLDQVVDFVLACPSLDQGKKENLLFFCEKLRKARC